MVSLLFGKRYPRTKIGHIYLDATISENHDYSATITQFPVENGTVISDHIFNQPVKLTIDGLISDSPLTNSGNPFTTVVNNLSQFFTSNTTPTRSNAIFDQLMNLYSKRELIEVITGLKLYKNMAISSLSFPRTNTTGQALNFRIELIQLQFASTLDISYQYSRYVQGQSEPITREQVSTNANYPLFSQDPPDSFKDQAQSFIDVGTQTLQPLKPTALEVSNSTFSKLQASGIYR